MSDTPLLYIADPMCSWCWGFAPTLAAIESTYPNHPVQLVLGGLAPDSTAAMDQATRTYVQQAWRDVAKASGAKFNFDFWTECSPRRSTWVACRAVIVARRFHLEREMFEAIQHAYYLEAKNPSDDEVLADLAQQLEIPRSLFLEELNAPQTQRQLEDDFELRRRLNAHGFPSIGIIKAGQPILLHSGFCTPDHIYFDALQ